MKDNHPSQEKALNAFDKWLKENKIEPRRSVLSQVRGRLDAGPADFDDLLDDLFRSDTRLRDPDMLQRVRMRLETGAERQDEGKVAWFNWLAPLAAAATLTLAFVSFQSSAPEGQPAPGSPAGLTMVENRMPQIDSDVTEIFALAVNLQGGPDMTKLESVEDLAFLFD